MASAHIETIKNHYENIEIIIKGYKWGKEAEECFKEIGKSVRVIKSRIEFIEEER